MCLGEASRGYSWQLESCEWATRAWMGSCGGGGFVGGGANAPEGTSMGGMEVRVVSWPRHV